MRISRDHPRFQSLETREHLAKALKEGIVVPQGLIAHGRGEAFDYLLGERSSRTALKAAVAGAASLLTAQFPVISVNGNTVALAGKQIISLARAFDAPIEINLFHRSRVRERRIARYLSRLGAKRILGIEDRARSELAGVASPRKIIDSKGMGIADVVVVPLEDGDRTQALRRAGKRVIAIDLNPLSRTSQSASISIIDNVVRAIPALTLESAKMRRVKSERLSKIVDNFDNTQNLAASIGEMVNYLKAWTSN